MELLSFVCKWGDASRSYGILYSQNGLTECLTSETSNTQRSPDTHLREHDRANIIGFTVFQLTQFYGINPLTPMGRG